MSSPADEHESSVVSRYDEFQAEAVANLLSDYGEKKNGRFLLVIPTGGGKTYTAVKAINRLFASDVLDPKKDQVVWGAHRRELTKQAEETFQEYAETNPGADYSDRVKVGMMSKVMSYVKDNSDKVRIAIIDEAHHAVKKNITYGPLFNYPNLGILGLTATPSRHDGEPLDFEKESYSIGFPDMVERQLILSPAIDRVEGGRFEEIYAKGVTGFSGLDELDCPERDKKIIGQLLAKPDKYEKVIIYAATKQHVRNLHNRIKNSDLVNKYESIDFILGGNEYSGNDPSRDDFIARIKGYSRSIVVNCDVLTEGYDDPTVNTVVMATPTRSKLVYMQAIGRCIRVDKANPLKQAFIVEVADDLPNIRYRINNRWLFSEISDALEPAVEDRVFSSAEEFKEAVSGICTEYGVRANDLVVPEWDKSMRYSLLLFRSYVGDGRYRHLPILIDGRNRPAVSNWFNFLSERMANFHSQSINSEAAMKMARFEGISGLEDQIDRQLIYESMEEAYKVVASLTDEESDKDPWITFVAFRFKSSDLPLELLTFLEDVVNREQMAELIKSRSFRAGDYLIKLPLPLASSIGMIVSADAFSALEALIEKLEQQRDESGKDDHLPDVVGLLKSTVLPIPPMYLHSLPTVVRESIEYSYKLD
jgi:superfamily II DNA or RNA helicase